MINKLVIENLRHRWVRTLLCALVVGVQVMSILTLMGLSRGMLQDSADRAKGTGAEIMPVELITTMNAVDVPQFEKMSGGFHFLAGGLPQAPDDIIVDNYYA